MANGKGEQVSGDVEEGGRLGKKSNNELGDRREETNFYLTLGYKDNRQLITSLIRMLKVMNTFKLW